MTKDVEKVIVIQFVKFSWSFLLYRQTFSYIGVIDDFVHVDFPYFFSFPYLYFIRCCCPEVV